jgi:hypothetical protein
MRHQAAFIGLTLSVCLCATSPAFARERTYYSTAERYRAHERDAVVLAADPERSERERVRSFYLVPEIGTEIATIGAQIYAQPGQATVARSSSVVAAAPAFGVQLGWRLGHFNLGARYQGAVFVDNVGTLPTLNLDKLYAEIGVNAHAGPMLFQAFVDAGYAFAVTRNSYTNGVGGKIGFNFDFLVTRAFTLGPGVAFDVHAYDPFAGPQWVVAYGGTAFLRLGFQI